MNKYTQILLNVCVKSSIELQDSEIQADGRDVELANSSVDMLIVTINFFCVQNCSTVIKVIQTNFSSR